MFQAKAMEISLSEPQAFNLGDFQGKKSINEIEFVLSKKIKNKFEIVILVLPFQIKSAYKKIKQLCYLELGILSQIVLTSTLEKKGYKSICSKLVQQIIVKVGSKLWVPELSKKLPQNLMLVGADMC